MATGASERRMRASRRAQCRESRRGSRAANGIAVAFGCVSHHVELMREKCGRRASGKR